MVQVLLEELRADPRFEVYHVDARVSDDMGDIGSFRPQKFLRLSKCILQAWWIRLRYGHMAFYYVPAPAKKSAIIRDWLVMALCRPLFPELILHWHAYGLGEWASSGSDWARKMTRWALGRAELSIVLNNYNKRDAEVFAPKRIEVVSNGIPDLFPDYDARLREARQSRALQLKQLVESDAFPEKKHSNIARNGGMSAAGLGPGLERVRFLFLGHLIESKGFFVAIEATRMANEELRRSNAAWRAHLTLAGSFSSEGEAVRAQASMEAANRSSGTEGPCVTLAGFLDSGQKKSALEEADCLVFPTFYEGETQGLVLLEAMSAGLAVITTSWRGVTEVLPEGYQWVVVPDSSDALARAMVSQPGDDCSATLRRRYREGYTIAKHVELMVGKLSGLPEHEKAFRN